ncbi:hypothetical protein Mapa_014540 [Marchantia paleacea]|nr:hypothetical protein Mapa_014540 [Marchantia paleacea]
MILSKSAVCRFECLDYKLLLLHVWKQCRSAGNNISAGAYLWVLIGPVRRNVTSPRQMNLNLREHETLKGGRAGQGRAGQAGRFRLMICCRSGG